MEILELSHSVFNFSKAVPPEPGEAQQQTLGQPCEAEHWAGHGLVQWTHSETGRLTQSRGHTRGRRRSVAIFRVLRMETLKWLISCH